MLRILIVAGIVALVLTLIFPEGGNRKDFAQYIDTISIFVAVLLVACVQAQTNYSQQKAFLEINKLKNSFEINVIRGEETRIQNTELLVGDILSLKNGDRVAADCLFISGHNLKVNNSQETGESVAVSVSEKFPFVLSGGAVESGDARCLVTAVGPHTQSGVTMMQIQGMNEDDEETPLQIKLTNVAKILTYIGLVGAIVTFIILLIYWIIDAAKKWENKLLTDLVKRIMTAITIFICAVPEGLPLAVTLSLGFSMKRMMKDNNFVRHLNACETMGGATTICSDKTGTLTQNKMTVVQFAQVGKVQKSTNPQITDSVLPFFTTGICVNTSAYLSVNEETGQHSYIGPSSECALLQMMPDYNVDYKHVREKLPIKVVHEFNSTRKRMSTVVKEGESFRLYAKGAPDFMLRYCTKYMDVQGGVHDISQSTKDEILTHVSNFADQALRTLLLAFRDLGSSFSDSWSNPDNVEKELIVVGIAAIQDPLRPEVKDAIQACKRASVIVRMVTGDFINTAKAIATECGIYDPNGDNIAIEGQKFSETSKKDLLDIVPKLRVMGRSSPRDKYRLVSLLMDLGEVVAVTGDGSNDSPALKKASVGLSMGLCGTELAKMASDIVILDDNFNSIVSALKWGRCVYDNVRAFLQFQLTVNLSAMLVAIVGSCALEDSPLRTIQLLWVNLIMDSFGALALATFPPSDSLLNRPPYSSGESLLSTFLIRNIAVQTVYQAIVLFIVLFLSDKMLKLDNPSKEYISTLVFNTFVFCQVFNLINSRSANQDMSVFDGLLKNVYFIVIILVIVGFQIIIIFFLGSVFKTERLDWKGWVASVGFAAGGLIVGFIIRLFKVKDKTTELLEAQRKQKRLEVEKQIEEDEKNGVQEEDKK